MNRNFFTGIALIFAAIFFFFNDFNFREYNIVFLGIATLILGYIAIKGALDFDSFGTILPLALLFYIYNNHFHFMYISAWSIFIVAILLSIGISFIIPKKIKYKNYYNSENTAEYSETTFGESVRYLNINNSDRFAATTTFGDTSIYFENVEIDENKEFSLHIASTFGDVKIYIPTGWNVDNQLNSIFGDIKDYTQNSYNNNIKITITGSAKFGDVKIYYQ